jgi:PTS system nitrogen regulatory IIA component
MNFKKVLTSGCFCLHLKSDTKRGVIEEMVDMLFAAGKIKDREAALNAVLDRERKMSTGMQFGIAIPHGKTNSMDDLVAVLALKKEGMDFASLDGKPSNIFVMTISPSNQTGPHMQYLTEISKLLNSSVIREKLLAAGSEEEIVQILTNGQT